MSVPSDTVLDPEIDAISVVYAALRTLDADAQKRVITYVSGKLGLGALDTPQGPRDRTDQVRQSEAAPPEQPPDEPSGARAADDELDGISPVAQRWMRRNGLTAAMLSSLFSLGVDEIDLVAKKVPGSNKKDKMLSVFRLKGVAAYLGAGVARFTHEEVKEACVHYDAFDTNNFAAYLKSIASEVSGTKESGYTLTARGLTEATEMIKGLVASKGGGGAG